MLNKYFCLKFNNITKKWFWKEKMGNQFTLKPNDIGYTSAFEL